MVNDFHDLAIFDESFSKIILFVVKCNSAPFFSLAHELISVIGDVLINGVSQKSGEDKAERRYLFVALKLWQLLGNSQDSVRFGVIGVFLSKNNGREVSWSLTFQDQESLSNLRLERGESELCLGVQIDNGVDVSIAEIANAIEQDYRSRVVFEESLSSKLKLHKVGLVHMFDVPAELDILGALRLWVCLCFLSW